MPPPTRSRRRTGNSPTLHHPDKNPGDASAEDRFKAIGEAYAVLGDAEKREAYDRFGTAGPGRGGEGFGDFDPGFGSIFDDIFEGFFGGRSRPYRAERPPRGGPAV